MLFVHPGTAYVEIWLAAHGSSRGCPSLAEMLGRLEGWMAILVALAGITAAVGLAQASLGSTPTPRGFPPEVAGDSSPGRERVGAFGSPGTLARSSRGAVSIACAQLFRDLDDSAAHRCELAARLGHRRGPGLGARPLVRGARMGAAAVVHEGSGRELRARGGPSRT
ncbi:MAG: hypothetical protein MI919_06605 [Holophagales bacterium]|nr:hypothetical protein [Holophagales bacterium]